MVLAPKLFLLKPFSFSSQHPKFHQGSDFVRPSPRKAEEPEDGDRGVHLCHQMVLKHLIIFFGHPNSIYKGKLRLHASTTPQSTESRNGDTVIRETGCSPANMSGKNNKLFLPSSSKI